MSRLFAVHAVALITLVGIAVAQTPAEKINSYAMECEHEVVQELLDQGVDPDSRDDTNMTALIWAAGSGCLETVQILLAAGADPNAVSDDGIFPLIEAVNGDAAAAIEEMHPAYAEIVKALLAAGADPSHKDLDGYSALELAREVGYQHLVEILEGAD